MRRTLDGVLQYSHQSEKWFARSTGRDVDLPPSDGNKLSFVEKFARAGTTQQQEARPLFAFCCQLERSLSLFTVLLVPSFWSWELCFCRWTHGVG